MALSVVIEYKRFSSSVYELFVSRAVIVYVGAAASG